MVFTTEVNSKTNKMEESRKRNRIKEKPRITKKKKTNRDCMCDRKVRHSWHHDRLVMRTLSR